MININVYGSEDSGICPNRTTDTGILKVNFGIYGNSFNMYAEIYH